MPIEIQLDINRGWLIASFVFFAVPWAIIFHTSDVLQLIPPFIHPYTEIGYLTLSFAVSGFCVAMGLLPMLGQTENLDPGTYSLLQPKQYTLEGKTLILWTIVESKLSRDEAKIQFNTRKNLKGLTIVKVLEAHG